MPQVRPGVYYIDVPPNAKIPHDFTFRAYSVIRASDVLLYTPHFERKKRLFYLTRCVCAVKPYTPEAAEEARQAAARGKVASVIYSPQIDDIYVPEKRRRARTPSDNYKSCTKLVKNDLCNFSIIAACSGPETVCGPAVRG